MELTLNIKVDERFASAVEMLAAALATYAKAYEKTNAYVYECAGDCGPHPGEPIENDADRNAEKAAMVEELKQRLDLEDVKKPAITADFLRETVMNLVQSNPDYNLDIKGALKVCGAERLGLLAEDKYEEFYNLIKDIAA